MALQSAVAALPGIIAGRRAVFLLDYDGTLAAGPPIPSTDRRPSPGVVNALSALHETGSLLAIVTGRGEANLIAVLPAATRFTVASSHGLRIRSGTPPAPGAGGGLDLVRGADELPAVYAAFKRAAVLLAAAQASGSVPAGVRINDESHFFSFQVAGCNEAAIAAVRAIAAEAAGAFAAGPESPPPLHVRELKGVVEVRPASALSWDKGTATAHLLRASGLAGRSDVAVIAVGDDVSDEAMFAAALGAKCGAAAAVAVGTPAWPSAATHAVADPHEVEELLAAAVALGARSSTSA